MESHGGGPGGNREGSARGVGDRHRIVNRDLLRLELGWPAMQCRWQATMASSDTRDMEEPEEPEEQRGRPGWKKPQSLMPALIQEQLQRIERNPEP